MKGFAQATEPVELLIYCKQFTCRMASIESAIEQPQIYMFARSRSSIRDQALYTPLRVEHLDALQTSTYQDSEYTAKMRVGIGKMGNIFIS